MNSKVKSPNILTKIVGPCPYPCGDARCDNYSEPSSDCGGNPPSTKQYTDVTSDPNFISMVQIDQQLYDFTDTSLGLWSEAEFTSYLNSMNSAVNDAQVATVIQNAGYSNSTLIVATLNQKINKVLQLVQNNNRFAGKTPEEIKNILIGAYTEYWDSPPVQIALLSDICSEQYKNGMEDCDYAFTITVVVSIIEGFGAAITSTPIGGAFVVSVGIGGAWAVHENCKKGVVRDWKLCRQSNPIH